jgi:hypothetical protein
VQRLLLEIDMHEGSEVCFLVSRRDQVQESDKTPFVILYIRSGYEIVGSEGEAALDKPHKMFDSYSWAWDEPLEGCI